LWIEVAFSFLYISFGTLRKKGNFFPMVKNILYVKKKVVAKLTSHIMQIFTSNYITKSISSLILVIRHLKTLVLLNSTGRQEPIPRKSWLFVSGMKTLSLLLLCLSLGFTGSVFAQANFVASPASVSINPGEPFSVTIALQTGNSQAVDGAEIHLDFDPSILQVTNVTALSNSQLPTEIVAPTVNNSTGTISYVTGNVSSTPLANFDFLQIDFQAIGATDTSIDYDFTFPFSFTDITLAGTSVFGTAESIPVTIANVNQPPVFNSTIANQTNNEQDIVVALDASANDPDGNSISYEATNLPAGLSIDANGFISGTIDLGASNGGSLNTGVYAVVITATDDGASPLSVSQNFQWTVTTPTVPTYTITANAGDNGSIEPLTAAVNEGGSQLFTITPDNGYEVADVLIDGNSVGATTEYLLENVTANTSISASFSLIAVNSAPEIILAATATVGEGGTINVPLSISDTDGDNLTVTITSISNEPQELETSNTGAQTDPYPFDATNFLTETSISNNPGSYSSSLDFAPQFGDGGSNGDGSGVYTVTVQVADEDGNSITQDIDVTVTDVPQFIADTGTTRLEAESYDNQGPANLGSGANGIGVEVGTITNIGFTTNGDFAEYIIDVQTAGTYQFDFYVSRNSTATHTMTINGGPATITVPNYSDWADYSNVVSANVILSAGSQTLRFDWTGAAGNYFNIDYFEATKVTDDPFQLCIASGSGDLTAFGRSFVGDPGNPPPTGLGFTRTGGLLFAGYDGVIADAAAGDETTLYQKEIYGGKTVGTGQNPPFTYEIPVANGIYQVDLYFAEVFHPSSGGRIFDVFLENNLMLDEYDLVDPIKDGLSTNQTAIVRTYNVSVTDGILSLQIGPASVDNGKLSGICVTEAPGANLHPITAIGDLTYDALVAVADPLNIVDPENDELSIVFNGLPASLSYDPTTNQIQGTPLATDANTYTINAIISDGTNSPVTEEFTLVINPVVGDNPPTIDAIADVEVNEGELLSQAIMVTDDNLPAATIEVFDVSAGGTNNPFTPTTAVDVGTLVDNSGGSYTFNWTPDAGTGRSYLARVTAADGVNAPVIEEFRINVAQQLPGTILARTFNNPVPWYGSSAPDASNGYSVAIETSPAQNIGYIDNGDFVEYLINVPTAGVYDLEVFAGKGNGGTTVVTFSEENAGGFATIGSVNVIQTGWQTYASYKTQVTFTNAGVQTLRFDFNGGANIRDFNFKISTSNNPPVVTISTPVDGIALTTGTSLDFIGLVEDVEDDDATLTAALSWTSNLDGPLGTGGTISSVLTTVGTHTITAEVTDLDTTTPLTGTAAITLVVTETDPAVMQDFA
jgi:hypothetical protein